MTDAKAKQGPAQDKARKGPQDALDAARESALAPNQGGTPTAEAAAEYANSLLPTDPATVTVTEDVYEEVTPPGCEGTGFTTKRLKYHKGQVVYAETARAAGIPTG